VSAGYDVVVVGGGHNGLVAVFDLARAGLRTLVLERRPVVGGAAVTDEIHPGFRVPTLAHATGPIRPDVVRDMQLERHGLTTIEADPRVFAPSADGGALVLYTDAARSAEAIARLSRKDAESYRTFQRVLGETAKALRPLLDLTPPSVDGLSAADLRGLIPALWRARGLGVKGAMRLARWAPMSAADLAEEWFETDALRAVVAARGVFGTFLGPMSPGTGAVLLLRAASDPHPAGPASFVKGGTGALTAAMAVAAREAGAEIRTRAEVARIVIKGGEVAGVALASGEEIHAKTVVSNADPQRTLLRLVDPVHLEPGFLSRLRGYMCRGALAKVNLALAELPRFPAASDGEAVLRGRIHIGPDVAYIERAFDDAKHGAPSRRPYLEATIPSLTDPTLAPAGRHVMSVYVQYAPFTLKQADWASRREALGDAVVETLAAYAPNLPRAVLARQVLTPQDLEAEYGLTGGHPFHGELALDQLFLARPLLECARYRTPIRGLFLCGAGTHPGNGLTGASGRNAAREIRRALRR